MGDLSSVSATITVIFKLVEFGLEYSEVSSDTKQLLENISLADRKINAAKRLRRQRSQWLDTDLKKDVDADIGAAVDIVNSIGQTIEACRADLETNNKKVKPLNKLKWLLRDSAQFRSKGWSLSNTVAVLLQDINSMDHAHPPPSIIGPPSYVDSQRFVGRLTGPSMRRRLAKQRSESSLPNPETDAGRERNTDSCRPVQTHDGHLSSGYLPQTDWSNYTDDDYRMDYASEGDAFGMQQVPLETPLPSSRGLWANQPWTRKPVQKETVVELEGDFVTAPKPRRLRSACIR